MGLPASGQISMNDIRIELGVPSQSPFGLNEARNGTYVTLNQFSPSLPPATGQVSLASWYNYCQACGYSTIVLGYSAIDVVTACGTTPNTTYYYTGALITGNVIYSNIGQTIATPGYYSNGTDWWYQDYNGFEQIVILDYGSCSTPSYDLYYADEYFCDGLTCVYQQSNVLVALPAGTTPSYTRWYALAAGGFSYQLTSTAPAGPGAILALPSFSTCALACGI